MTSFYTKRFHEKQSIKNLNTVTVQCIMVFIVRGIALLQLDEVLPTLAVVFLVRKDLYFWLKGASSDDFAHLLHFKQNVIFFLIVCVLSGLKAISVEA